MPRRRGYLLPRRGYLLPRRGSEPARRGYLLPRRGSEPARRGYLLLRRGYLLPRRGYLLHRRGSEPLLLILMGWFLLFKGGKFVLKRTQIARICNQCLQQNSTTLFAGLTK